MIKKLIRRYNINPCPGTLASLMDALRCAFPGTTEVQLLALVTLATKWNKSLEPGLQKLNSPCAFCIDCGGYCDACLVPARICIARGTGGLFGEISANYDLRYTYMSEISNRDYRAIVNALASLLEDFPGGEHD